MIRSFATRPSMMAVEETIREALGIGATTTGRVAMGVAEAEEAATTTTTRGTITTMSVKAL